MIIVDAHCDTITRIMEDNSSLYKNKFHTDLSRMNSLGNFVQFFAAFIEPIYIKSGAIEQAIKIFDYFYKQIDEFNKNIELCLNYHDVAGAIAGSKVAAILSIEDGVALQGNLSALRMFYRLGVRSICLTWNHRNEIADGVLEETTQGGLTTFGKELIKEMNSLGMIIDLSHISEKGFWDVMALTNAPIIASHSNSRALCNHPRNLWNEQILAIKKNRGVIGINFYPTFLKENERADIKSIIEHIDYIAGLAGTDIIGIGADFDGVDFLPNGINGVQDLYKIFDELLKLNYSEENINKIAGENFLRVIQEIL